MCVAYINNLNELTLLEVIVLPSRVNDYLTKTPEPGMETLPSKCC